MLKAGFARRCITPGRAMTMAGFDRRTLPAEGTLDELYVSVLALQQGDATPFVLCVFDLLGTDRILCEKVHEELPLPMERVWICATHTHSAPRGAFSGGESQDDAYISLLTKSCKAAVLAALEDLSPAAAQWGEGAIEGVASLRDVPREQAAYRMPLLALSLVRKNDTVRWGRFQCHPTVLDERSRMYSRDLPGLAGAEGTVLCNGACADLSTRFTRREASPEELLRLGERLQAGFSAVECRAEPQFGSVISTAAQTLTLPYGSAVRGEERVRLLEDLRLQAETCSDQAALRELDACIAVLERGERVLPRTRTVTVAACDLGTRLLLALPFEVAQEDGARLEREAAALCGKPAHLLCYCGGYDGYLPHETTGINYQDLATGYPPEARSMIWNGLLDCAAKAVK